MIRIEAINESKYNKYQVISRRSCKVNVKGYNYILQKNITTSVLLRKKNFLVLIIYTIK